MKHVEVNESVERPQFHFPQHEKQSDKKMEKQVRQIHKAVVKRPKPMWPATTHSMMLPDSE